MEVEFENARSGGVARMRHEMKSELARVKERRLWRKKRKPAEARSAQDGQKKGPQKQNARLFCDRSSTRRMLTSNAC